MRGAFGLVVLLVSLAIVGVLVKKQTSSLSVAVPGASASAPAVQAGNLQQQSQQIQAQVLQSVETAIQPTRTVPDEK